MRTGFITILVINWMVVELKAQGMGCTDGYYYLEETGHCYIVPDGRYSWSEAKRNCQRKGLALASLSNFSLNILNKLRSKLIETYGSYVLWVDAKYIQTGDGGVELRWVSDNTIVAPGLLYPWTTGEPGLQCNSLTEDPNFPYFSSPCMQSKRFLCQEVTTSVPVPVPNAPNPTAGAIQPSITTANKCPFDEFQCQDGSGNCIRGSWICDGEEDCTDGSDEKDCFNNDKSDPKCGFGSFMCEDASHRCIRKSWRCDGEDDCSDASDEKNCHSNKVFYARCPFGMFMCQDASNRCIRESWRCNGDYDCRDGSDEKNCFTTSISCPSGEFMCKDASRRCIRESWRCDGEDDCSDGSDEKNCYISDSTQQRSNTTNEEILIYEDLRNLVEKIADQQETDRSRIFVGCSQDLKKRFSECLSKCKKILCPVQELKSFLSACKSGIKQSCTQNCNPECIKNQGDCDNGKCLCKDGFSGDDCSIKDCNPVCVEKQGDCVDGKCICKPGFTGEDCGTDIVKCGVENPVPTRIVNGVDVNVARKYSWQVGLKPRKHRAENYFCGGSIITNKHILTAAHCFYDFPLFAPCFKNIPDKVFVGIGDHQQEDTIDDLSDVTDLIRSMSITTHKDYNCETNDNDIAIIELSRPIDLLKHADVLHPICLPKDDCETYEGLTATVSGWGGLVGYNIPENQLPGFQQKFPNILQETQVKVLKNSKCSSQIDGKYPPAVFTDNMVCAATEEGYEDGGTDACQGDSGGPLSVKDNEKHVQIGLVSFGFGCASKGNPGVYARVCKFLPWIENIVGTEKTYNLP